MRRLSLHTVPALVTGALFACGIIGGKLVEDARALLLAASLVVLAAGFISLTNSHKHAARLRPFLFVGLPLVLGALKVTFDYSNVPRVPDAFIKRPVTVVGTVLDLSLPRGNRRQFVFRSDSLFSAEGRAVPMRSSLLVTLTQQRRDSAALPLRYGQRIALHGQMYRPSEERNPGEFNARAYYDAQGITYLMRVRGQSHVVLLDSSVRGGLGDWVMREIVLPLRFFVGSVIDRTIGGEEGELLKGILIGERGGIPYATHTAFVNSGIAHILAVSGSNVAVVYLFFTTLFGLLRIPRTRAIPLNALMLILYMLLTGSQPPIVRATVMALVLLSGKLYGGKANSLNAVGVAALIILAYDARQMFDVGFQLSFAAVVSIVYFYPSLNALILTQRGPALWRRALVPALQICAMTLVATLGTLPLTAIYFGKVSVVGVFTNVVVLPLVAASVTLGFVMVLVGWAAPLAESFGAVNAVLLRTILGIADFSGSLSWSFVETLRFKPVHAVPLYFALLWLFHFRARKLSRVFFVLLFCSLIAVLVMPEARLDVLLADRLRVSFIDVGQGDAALIEFPGGRSMLIDAGAWSEEYDAGEQIVVPFLKRRGIATLDWFVASHPHADHIGGAASVFESLDVRSVLEGGPAVQDPVYVRYRQAIEAERSAVLNVRHADTALAVNGAKVYVLYPQVNKPTGDSSAPYANLNNMSVVMKLVFGETSFLFVGDLEREGEAELIRKFEPFLASDVLKVGHHGSNTSSTPDLLERIRPRYAIISVGRNNKFRHPSEEVIDRLQTIGAEVLRTDEEGAIVFESDGKTLERVVWR